MATPFSPVAVLVALSESSRLNGVSVRGPIDLAFWSELVQARGWGGTAGVRVGHWGCIQETRNDGLESVQIGLRWSPCCHFGAALANLWPSVVEVCLLETVPDSQVVVDSKAAAASRVDLRS